MNEEEVIRESEKMMLDHKKFSPWIRSLKNWTSSCVRAESLYENGKMVLREDGRKAVTKDVYLNITFYPKVNNNYLFLFLIFLFLFLNFSYLLMKFLLKVLFPRF